MDFVKNAVEKAKQSSGGSSSGQPVDPNKEDYVDKGTPLSRV